MNQSGGSGEFKRGWTILLAAFLGIGVSYVSLTFYSAGIWVKPWQDDFGWTRGEIGLGQGLSTLILVLMAPFAGRLIDKYGLRKVSTISLFLYGLSIYAVSKMTGALWMYFVLIGVLTFAAVASTPLAYTRAVNAWFHKNRGLALGISLTSTGFAAYLIPKYLTPYVAENGWRDGYFILFTIVMIVLPIVWLLLKEKPHEAQRVIEANGPQQSGITFKEAIRMKTFWILAIVFFVVAISVVGLIPSFIPLLQDAGLSPARAGSLAAILGGSVMIGRLLTGFLIDRIFAPYVTCGVFLFVGVGCLSLGLGGVGFATMAAVALGFAVGAEVDLIGYFTARYFGMEHYGVIYGFQYSVFTLGAGLSPIIAGFVWDAQGNYDSLLIGGGAMVILAALLSLTLPRFDTQKH